MDRVWVAESKAIREGNGDGGKGNNGDGGRSIYYCECVYNLILVNIKH